jgi:putative ABC transport system ATP-binding protein
MTTLVKLRNLHKTYQRGPEKIDVLHGIDLDIESQDFVALMGPSGSGKTTLLNLIGGLDSPTEGEIDVAGQRIDRMSGGQLALWRSRNVGFVFQFYNLMPTLTAQKNVELPLLLTSLSGAQRKRNAAIALELVGLQDRARHRPAELSGGQQQRVAIARAIVAQPQVLFADEPTGNLDTVTSNEIMKVLAALNEQRGITIVMVTHEPDIAAWTRRIVRFRDGAIESDDANTPVRGAL